MYAEGFVLPRTLLALWTLPRTDHTNYPLKRGLKADENTGHRGRPDAGTETTPGTGKPHGEGRETRGTSMGIAGKAPEVQGGAGGDSEEFSGPRGLGILYEARTVETCVVTSPICFLHLKVPFRASPRAPIHAPPLSLR